MKTIPSSVIAIAAVASSILLSFTPHASGQTITPLTGGDSNEGLDLTGLNVIYALDQGQNPSGALIQGVSFLAAPINNNTFTAYSGNVVLSSMDRTDPGFSPSGWGATPDDTAMITLNSTISYGAFQQFAYAVTAGTQYTIFSIISPGSVGGRPSDVAFFDGLASSFAQFDVVAASIILADNLNVPANNASVVSYTYTATTTGFNTLIVAGSDTYGVAGGGDQNAVSTGFAVAAAVPEPQVVGLVMLGTLGLLVFWRRRHASVL